MEEMACLHVTISWSLISCIKAECGGDCTVFDAVAAVLWQCRTRVVISNPDTPAALVFSSDMRGLVRSKRGYYGNCVMGQPVQAQSGLVANSYIKDLVKLIRLAKEKTPDILTNGGGGDQQEGDPEAARDGVPHRGRHGARHGDGAPGRAARVGGGDGEEPLPLLRSLHAQPDDQPQGAQLRPGLRPRGGTVYVFTVI